MVEESFNRKLSAILIADVKGYSRLMGEDEVATVATLKKYRDIISSLVGKQSGQVVDSPGDNLLAEFRSVVDAVECAVRVQKTLKDENASLPENRRMEFRIGVNLGDVIDDEGRIYGDGVNVAARLEGLADGGGICISRTAFDQVKNKLKLGYEYLGEHAVKNIAEPVRVYKVLMDPKYAGQVIGEAKPKPNQWRWAAIVTVAILIIVAGIFAIWNFYLRPDVEPASVEKMAFSLPDRPSIAVLPFDNLSGDPEQEYFSDGLTEEIITSLSRVPKLFVIARNSTFSYKGRPVKVQQVAEELGVRYVLEGSFRKADERVRITAQLIDAVSGHHLWAERYDRDLRDIFVLQDEITLKIINALQVELTEGEHARLWGKGTDNIQAYLKSLRARELYLRQTKEDNTLARRAAEEAIALDPEYAPPYHVLSVTHFMDTLFRTTKSPKESMKRAVELAQKAIALDDSYALAHGWLGILYAWLRKHEKGIMEAQKGVALDPNGAHGYLYLCMTLRFAGRFEEAVQAIEKAMRLNPFPPNTYFRMACGSYIFVGRYEEAIVAGKKAVTFGPNDYMAHMLLAAAYSLASQQDEARIAAAEVLRLNPKFSVTFWAKTVPFKNQSDTEHIINALRKAGIPETPLIPLPDEPSIAVLPFKNMSGDLEQEFFSDGITEEIITALSKVPNLFVIARNSSFTYKGKSVWIPTVGKELGVKYVLEGSVRKAGDKVRVTAQLIDAQTNNHIWAERYDRDLKDIFAIQDEITKEIIAALQPKLMETQQAAFFGKGTDNLQAYLKWLQAKEHFLKVNKDDNILARKKSEEAIALDPDYVAAITTLAWAHAVDARFGWSKSPKQSLVQAEELARKAITLDETYSDAHRLWGYIYLQKRQYDEAIASQEKAVALSPNWSTALAHLGMGLVYACRPEEGIRELQKAIRLNPMAPTYYHFKLGRAYRMTEQYEEAISEFKKALHGSPNSLGAWIGLASTYSLLGQEAEAREAAAKVLTIHPKFSSERFIMSLPFKNQSENERIISALRKAGLK